MTTHEELHDALVSMGVEMPTPPCRVEPFTGTYPRRFVRYVRNAEGKLVRTERTEDTRSTGAIVTATNGHSVHITSAEELARLRLTPVSKKSILDTAIRKGA